jgi:ribosomal-protein-alanine N-acetyltransferase
MKGRMHPLIREYQNQDKSRLEHLMLLNVPQYFDRSEVDDFMRYLEEERESYWVVEVDSQVVACGGVNFPDLKTGRISWDLVHPDFQGKGIGRLLLNFRLKFLKESACDRVEVRTSQFTEGFYQKNGFHTVFTKPNYWSEGYDLYHMERELHEIDF